MVAAAPVTSVTSGVVASVIVPCACVGSCAVVAAVTVDVSIAEVESEQR